MRRPPRNTYTPGQPLPVHLHAIGRPVLLFVPGAELIEAGTVARVNTNPDGYTYDIRGNSGGTFRDMRLGDQMNPQPGTFTYST